MNFFEHQAKARSASSRLVLLFALAVLGIVLAVDLAAYLAYGATDAEPGEIGALLVFSTLATIGIIGLGSLYRIASLRGGGEPIALQFGGVPVAEDSSDPSLRRLRNVVEEIAIASGVPVPKIFVLEHEAGINAFAAGYSPSDAVVAVTRGALDRLNRDELQGVIAHEFAHILNGDMRLNVRLIGVLFGILMLGVIGRKVLQHGRGRGKGAGAVLGAALIAMLVGYIGLFFGRMIKAGVSRTRESLADASAVQFTRQTLGLSGALKKIAGISEGSRLSDRSEAEEVSHMLFGDGVGYSKLFATHPPLGERIRALDPSFNPEQLETLSRQWLAAPPNGLEEDVHLGLDSPNARRLPSASGEVSVTPAMVAAQVAQPNPDDYCRADVIVAAIPDVLHTRAGRRDDTMPLLLGLLLDRDDGELAARQIVEIASRLGEAIAHATHTIAREYLHALHPQLRLPLASLAFPVLRMRPRPELHTFLDTVHAVVHSDGVVAPFEYCLGRLLHVQVLESLDPGRHGHIGRSKPGQVKQEIASLLAVVAHAGHADTATAQHAYLSGLQRILPRDHIAYVVPAEGVLALDRVWRPLDALDPLAKQTLVEALTAAISHDGRINVAESELLRTVCAVLHCPLPPMLERS